MISSLIEKKDLDLFLYLLNMSSIKFSLIILILLNFLKKTLIWWDVKIFGSIPSLRFLNRSQLTILLWLIILKFFPDSILACIVYLPSTNK